MCNHNSQNGFLPKGIGSPKTLCRDHAIMAQAADHEHISARRSLRSQQQWLLPGLNSIAHMYGVKWIISALGGHIAMA